MNIRLYSRFGRVLTAIVISLLLIAIVLIAANEGLLSAFAALPFAALLTWITMLLFWFPQLLADDRAITIRNVWIEYLVRWESIQRIDTKYALTLVTEHRTIAVWSAPAPGRHSVFNANREQGKHLPESTYLAGAIRPGDLPQSESGSAAAIIRREWERRRDLASTSQTEASSSQTEGVTQRIRFELVIVTTVLALLLAASLAV
jgi:hypothetical protein